jgi:hypothetical protein
VTEGVNYLIESQYTNYWGFAKSLLDVVTGNQSNSYPKGVLTSTFFPCKQQPPLGGRFRFYPVVSTHYYGGANPPCIKYGQNVYIKSTAGNWWLDSCGDSVFCPSDSSLQVIAADTNNRLYSDGKNYQTGQWVIEGGPVGQCVNVGDNINFKNLYSRVQYYLDVCEWGPLGTVGYGVQVYATNDRLNVGTGTWSILLNQRPCVPTTCAARGAYCGIVEDGCCGTLNCGDCPAAQTCGYGGNANVCGGCVPTSCEAQNVKCGTIEDGCGNTLTCGPQPTTCEAQGALCGSIDDGCGNTLQCGGCDGGQVCGGGDQPNVCAGASLQCGGTYQIESEYTGLSGYSKGLLDITPNNPSTCYPDHALLVQSYFPGTLPTGGLWQLDEVTRGSGSCIKYGVPIYIKNANNNWWLETCGASIACPGAGALQVHVADTNNRIADGRYWHTSQWVIEGGTTGTCVPVGADVNVKNLYDYQNSQFYLDVCQWGPCGINGYSVQVYPTNNRDGYGTGTWHFLAPVQAAAPVALNTQYRIRNEYAGSNEKSFLDLSTQPSGCSDGAVLAGTYFLSKGPLPSGGGFQFSEVNPSGNTCLTYGAVVNIKSSSQDLWLDTCGAANIYKTSPGCGADSLNVQGVNTPNRYYLGTAYNTGQWTVEGNGQPGTCVLQGDRVFFKNLYTSRTTYLDVCDWGPAGQGNGYFVQTYPTNTRDGSTAAWTILQ